MMHFDGRPIEYYLRSYRRQAHLSQKELAYLLGATTHAKVSRYEAGLRIPSLESGLAYEAALGEPVAKLFRGRYEAIQKEVEARRRKLEAQKEKQKGVSVGSASHHAA
jgi:transcriptional regulator with XRE-family HTH domain